MVQQSPRQSTHELAPQIPSNLYQNYAAGPSGRNCDVTLSGARRNCEGGSTLAALKHDRDEARSRPGRACLRPVLQTRNR
ncbi:hypothetical protein BX257_7129 [Streptomyces sp. 3212.3]|nr:hypothetical protein BX257_7129 [Streptomyces sp. 3212.3]